MKSSLYPLPIRLTQSLHRVFMNEQAADLSSPSQDATPDPRQWVAAQAGIGVLKETCLFKITVLSGAATMNLGTF